MSLTALESLTEEIKCYSLPYGGLGFASHVLTYYTIVCLWYGRKPLWPFSGVSFSRFDLALGGFGLLISTLLSVVTIVRCRDTWELLVIAVWKMSMSLLNGITAVHVAVLVIWEKMKKRKREKREREASSGSEVEKEVEPGSGEREAPIEAVVNPMRHAAWWIVIYIPGMLAGIAGLMVLVSRHLNIPGVRPLTAGFFSIVGLGVLVTLAGMIYRLRVADSEEKSRKIMVGGLVWVVGSFSILAVFYSDWALGMMTENIAGLPSGDATALYWTYWVSKRLPMLSL